MFAVSSVQVLTRAYYSLQDTVTPVKIGVLSVATNTGLSAALLRWTDLAHGGLAQTILQVHHHGHCVNAVGSRTAGAG